MKKNKCDAKKQTTQKLEIIENFFGNQILAMSVSGYSYGFLNQLKHSFPGS